MAAEQGSTGKQENSAAKTGAAETETAVQETEAADSIEISNVQELESFAQECRNDWYSYGKVFSLTADIDLTGTDFQGIPYFAERKRAYHIRVLTFQERFRLWIFPLSWEKCGG